MLHHRETDPLGSDFRPKRNLEEREVIIRRNGASKALMVVGSATISILMALLAFFAGRDRVQVDDDIARIDAIVTTTTAQVAAHETMLRVFEAGQQRLEMDIAETRKQTEETNVMLRTVLVEVKRR